MNGKLNQFVVDTDKGQHHITAYLPEPKMYAPGLNDDEKTGFENQGCNSSIFCPVYVSRRKSLVSMYTGESQDKFRSLASGALMSPEKFSALENMMEKNKFVEDSFVMNYGILLGIVYRDGKWQWKTHYAKSSVKLMGDETPLIPVAVVQSDGELPTGEMDIDGEVKFAASRSEKRNNRALYQEKIEVITSQPDFLNVCEKHSREVASLEFGNIDSSIWFESKVFVPDDGTYYQQLENEELNYKEWERAYYQAMDNDTSYRNEVLVLAAILYALPASKKLFLVCQNDKTAHDYGCGKRHHCHLNIVKNLLVNICANSSGKNKWHDAVVAMSQAVKVNK